MTRMTQGRRRDEYNAWASSRDNLRFRSYDHSYLTHHGGQNPDHSYLDRGFNSLRIMDDRLDKKEKGEEKYEVDPTLALPGGKSSRRTNRSIEVKNEHSIFPFLDLPLELRNEIYMYALAPEHPGWACEAEIVQGRHLNRLKELEQRKRKGRDIQYGSQYQDIFRVPALLLVCRQISQESLAILYNTTVFSLVMDQNFRIFAARTHYMGNKSKAVPFGWDMTRIRTMIVNLDIAQQSLAFDLNIRRFRFDFEGLAEMTSLKNLRIVVMGWLSFSRQRPEWKDGIQYKGRIAVTVNEADGRDEVLLSSTRGMSLGRLIWHIVECLPKDYGVKVGGSVLRKNDAGRKPLEISLGLGDENEAELQKNRGSWPRRRFISGEIMRRAFALVQEDHRSMYLASCLSDRGVEENTVREPGGNEIHGEEDDVDYIDGFLGESETGESEDEQDETYELEEEDQEEDA